MSGWAALRATLDGAAERGEAIRFWWRDDDAGRAAPALERLLDLADLHRAPLALAVVAAWLEPPAQAGIAGSDRATVLQHGIAHENVAPAGHKRTELGHRPLDLILTGLIEQRAALEDAFGALFMAVLVPPWNRIDPALVARLGLAGYLGLSTFGLRQNAEAAPGIRQINTHLDPIDWRGTRGFAGEEPTLGQLGTALDGPPEPVGVLSHHLAMDEAGWGFLDRLLGLLGRHPGARLCGAGELFGAGS
jgi:hypothetical protein